IPARRTMTCISSRAGSRGRATWLTPVISALWEAEAAWATWRNPISTKNTKIRWASWRATVITANREAEAEESLEPRRQRLQ
uniref:Uncharacterized protein n=1 Tax=Astyanax mexicanus TaxID=7994 RepID=A0A3B1K8Y9_ASTMX